MITNMMHKALSGFFNWWQGNPEPRNPMKYIDLTQNDNRWVPYTHGIPPDCPDCGNKLQRIVYGYPVVSEHGILNHYRNYYSGGCTVDHTSHRQWHCYKCPANVYFEGHESARLAYRQRELANRPLTQLDFWTDLESYISEHGSSFKNIKPKGQRWIDIGIGITGVKLRVVISYDVIYSDPWDPREPNDLKVELYFSGPKAKNRFNSFYVRRKQVERDLERNLVWQESMRYSVCRISSVSEMDLDKRYSWPGHISCLVEDLNDFYQYFRPIIRELQ